MIDINLLKDSMIKLIGSVDTTNEIMINGIECFQNKQKTIIQVNNIEDAKSILANQFILLEQFNPYSVMMKQIFNEYPYLVLLKEELDLPYPNKFYYKKELPLIIEYDDYCFIIDKIKIN